MITGVNFSLQGRKIFVGLSGGVDSAVTAALLQKEGAAVTGVFIKGWYPPGMPCSWSEDRRDAMRVAAHLRIPFVTLDASKQYRSSVIDYLLSEYRAGRTPNPDIMCNRDVKFGAFYNYAKEHGADYIATGHYAQALHTQGRSILARGVDPDKDQSYFLWAISREALSGTLFPLGGMKKSAVRVLAQQFNLPNARKRDSQGICFLGNISVEEFLEEEFGTHTGTAIDTDGTTIGSHSGVLLSTIGQRISLTDAPPGPWFVVAKNIATHTLTVSKELVPDIRAAITLTDTNWLITPSNNAQYLAQYRYHGPKIAGTYSTETSSFIPEKPIAESIASGQSLVLYDEDTLIGGGIIA